VVGDTWITFFGMVWFFFGELVGISGVFSFFLTADIPQ